MHSLSYYACMWLLPLGPNYKDGTQILFSEFLLCPIPDSFYSVKHPGPGSRARNVFLKLWSPTEQQSAAAQLLVITICVLNFSGLVVWVVQILLVPMLTYTCIHAYVSVAILAQASSALPHIPFPALVLLPGTFG